jgi:hypothetical protein
MLELWQIGFLLLLLLMAAAIAAILIRARRVSVMPFAKPFAPASSPPSPSHSASRQSIHVEMFDAEELIQFQPVDLPPDRLPPSFEASTTLHLGDRNFQVVEARPMTAAEFIASGKLRLVLREVRIEQVDVKDILFSLPTIDGVLPAIAQGSTKLNKQVVEIHEDDWRQVEFVALALQDHIDEHLRAIQRIYEEERVDDAGFRKLHVRESLTVPLAGMKLTVRDLLAAFDTPPAQLDGIAFHGVAGLVANGFALRLLSGIELLGAVDDVGQVVALCLSHARPNNALERDLPALARFAQRYQLSLINWCHVEQLPTEESAFRGYFENP